MAAFAGVRVLDLSDGLSGAFAARLFGDFGADVVLAEWRPDGHALRSEPPFAEPGDPTSASLLHAYANWNKRSVRCASPEHARQLAAAARVLVTTCRRPLPPLIQAAVDAMPHGSVHLSITPAGLAGPLSAVPGNSLTACARTGWCAVNGMLEMPPLQLPVRLVGYVAGVAGFTAAAAALYRAGGRSELADVSEAEAVAMTNLPWAKVIEFNLGSTTDGLRRSERLGPRCQFSGPRRNEVVAGPLLWPTRDGAINLTFGEWTEWAEACKLLRCPELAEGKYAARWGRNTLDPRPVARRFGEGSKIQGKWDLFHGLAKIRCVSGVVQDAQELLESEQFAARGFIVDCDLPPSAQSSRPGRFRAPGPIARFSQSPWRLARRAPALDEHAGAVDAEWAVAAAAAATASDARTAPQRARAMEPPLAGVRVLAFTQAWAGTSATEELAQLGADVVQIESRSRPDIWRGAGVPVPPAVEAAAAAASPGDGRQADQLNPLNTNAMYNTANLSKRAINLDMSHPKGQELFWRMVPNFDVVADNFAPHAMANWGITQESLEAVKPGIIFASCSAYGTEGPISSYPAIGNTIEPMAGISAMNGYAGGAVANTGGLIPDPISGYVLAASIVTALYYKKASGGRGQRVSAAMMEAVALTAPGDAIAEASVSGVVRAPAGNAHPRFAPHGVYRAGAAAEEERWLALAAETDEAWQALAARMGLGADARARLSTAAARKQHEAEVDAAVSLYCRSLPVSGPGGEDALDFEVAALGGLGVCAAKVQSLAATYAFPCEQWRDRGFMVPVTHPESGTHWMPTTPWRYHSTEPLPVKPAPCFGQHSSEVLMADAGVTAEAYADLAAEGVTGTEFMSTSTGSSKL